MRTKISFFHSKTQSGFTLVEALVAVSLFVVVALIAVSALVSLSDANRKSQAMREVVDNIAFAFQDISSEARWGKYFTCDSFFNPNPAPCPSGSDEFSFLSLRDLPEDTPDIEEYFPGELGKTIRYNITNGVIGKAYGENSYQPLTAPTIEVEDLKFYVYGNQNDDKEKARVLIVVKAIIDKGTDIESRITLQTTITQRFQD